MASAKDGYPHVVALFARELMQLDRSPEAQTMRESQWSDLLRTLDDGLLARVHEVNRLTPTIVEVVVRAPFAARHFEPGQFFRLQNFEAHAPVVDGTQPDDGRDRAHRRLDRSGARPAVADRPRDGRLVAPLRASASRASRSWSWARPARRPRSRATRPSSSPAAASATPCSSRSPRRSRTTAARSSTSPATRRSDDVFKRDEIEAGTDQVIWSVDAGEPIAPRRPQDRGFVGNIVQSMLAYAQNAPEIDLRDVQPHHRHRLRRHDARGARTRGTASSRRTSTRRTSASARSTRRCSA